eukprot:Em0006g1424a
MSEKNSKTPDAINRHPPSVRIGSCCGAAIASICITMAIVWMAVPAAMYSSSQNEPTKCNIQIYAGMVCREVLGNYSLCFNDSNPHSYDSTSMLQYHRELKAAQELQLALKNGTECQSAMMSYICLNAFDVTSSHTAVNTDMCTNTSSTGLTNGSAHTNLCSKYFYYDPLSGICRPTCSVQTTGTLSIYRAFHILAVLGCVTALITACVNHRVMRYFPSVLLIYWVLSSMLYNIITLIPCCITGDYFDYPYLLCRAQDILLFFLAYLLGMFPLVHTLILFWGVWSPLSSKDILGSARKKLLLHIFLVLFALAVPCVVCASLLAVYLTGGIKSNTDLDYALVPFYGICGLTAALVGLTLWKLIKVQARLQSSLPNNYFTCTPELKLSAVFFYVIVLSITTIVRRLLESYRTYGYIDDYFLCESSGNKICHLQPDPLNAAINAFGDFHDFLFSLSPYATLIYILPMQLIRMKLNKKCSKTSLTVV